MILKPRLERRLASLQRDKSRLPLIDRELGFLETLKSNQPPYLDALYLLAKGIPQGSKLDSLSMNRRGEVALRGSMRNSSEVTDFRSKLIASGFFANVSRHSVASSRNAVARCALHTPSAITAAAPTARGNRVATHASGPMLAR